MIHTSAGTADDFRTVYLTENIPKMRQELIDEHATWGDCRSGHPFGKGKAVGSRIQQGIGPRHKKRSSIIKQSLCELLIKQDRLHPLVNTDDQRWQDTGTRQDAD